MVAQQSLVVLVNSKQISLQRAEQLLKATIKYTYFTEPTSFSSSESSSQLSSSSSSTAEKLEQHVHEFLMNKIFDKIAISIQSNWEKFLIDQAEAATIAFSAFLQKHPSLEVSENVEILAANENLIVCLLSHENQKEVHKK